MVGVSRTDRKRNQKSYLQILLLCLLVQPIFAYAGQFIPANGRRDMVYDAKRNTLYISTDGGNILRYSLSTSSFLSPFTVGGNLLGVDLTPDMDTLVVADSATYGSNNRVHLVDLTTESPRTLEFSRASNEGGTYTTVFTNNNTLLVSSRFQGSGWVPLREADITTGTSRTLSSVRQDTMLTSSADHTVIGYSESNISSGEFGRYRVSDGSFAESGTGWFNFEIGTSRDGLQFALPTYGGMYIYDDDFTTIGVIGTYARDLPIGVVYSPVADLIYTAWWNDDAIQIYDAQTLSYIKSIDTTRVFDWVGNHAFQEGRLRISDNGLLLFATVDGGINMYEVPEPATLVLLSGGILFALNRKKQLPDRKCEKSR